MSKGRKKTIFCLLTLSACLNSTIGQVTGSDTNQPGTDLNENILFSIFDFYFIWPYNFIYSILTQHLVLEGTGGLPTFIKFDCPKNKYDLCVDVFFEDSEDMIMANVQDPEVPLVLIGTLNSNGREAVIILKDNITTSKDTVGICERIIKLDLSIYNFFSF